jgi:septum site-determining protein MinD
LGCSGLTDNTDNYSTLEPLLPNVQTNLQQSLDSEPKESRVIVVTSGKGVGKTTATANIGMSIARLGYKVVVIDADIGLKI